MDHKSAGRIGVVTIIAAADGSALGNPGPAGWAWYVDDRCWASGGWAHGTNNMGELTAVLDLLQQTAHRDEPLRVYCDSTYAINTVTKWMAGWKRRGWKKKDGKPVINVEIIKALDTAMTGRDVEFIWVKGHAGHELNEAADVRANAAATAYRDGGVPDPGPGFPGGSAAHPDAVPGQHQEDPALFGSPDDLDGSAAVQTEEPTAEVVALERSLLSAEVRTDAAAAAALLHPDWQEVGVSGRLWSREEMLAVIAPLDDPTLEVVSVTEVAAGVVLLVWRGDSGSGAALRSSLWVRRPGAAQWRQLFHQATAAD